MSNHVFSIARPMQVACFAIFALATGCAANPSDDACRQGIALWVNNPSQGMTTQTELRKAQMLAAQGEFEACRYVLNDMGRPGQPY
jgi:hypothetical protein